MAFWCASAGGTFERGRLLNVLAAQGVAVWPLGVYLAAAILLALAMLAVSYVLGERHSERTTGVPYESGVMPTGSSRVRYPTRFYLVAVFFVIFDLEAAFVLAWAVAVRELGWSGYVEMLVFVGVLLAALAYLWRQGALDWRTQRQRAERGGER
jgi:NADH-quinone oxidoreductase subunit A